jgi:molecular chaperone GrpE
MKEEKKETKQKHEDKKSKEKPVTKDNHTKILELTSTIQRLQADFENYKKQIDKQNKEYKTYIEADLLLKILPVVDSFELALKNTDNKDECIKGIKMIFSQLVQTLNEQGLNSINTINEKFDPHKHEVLLSVESKKEDGLILEEFQKGYTFKDKILRHSKVKVSKKKIDNPTKIHECKDECECKEKEDKCCQNHEEKMESEYSDSENKCCHTHEKQDNLEQNKK